MTFVAVAALVGLLPAVRPAVIGGVPQRIPGERLRLSAPSPDGTPAARQRNLQDGGAGGWRFRLMPTPSLRFGNVVRLDFRARLRLDTTDSPARVEERRAFDIGQRRVGIDGEVGSVVQFQIERELGSDESWRDVYVNYRQFDAIRLQGGQFKIPLSLDENTSSANLDFTYRSRVATQLAPGRDRGIMLHGRPFTRLLRYEIGVFEQDGRNARTSSTERVHGGRTVAGRVTVQPFAGRKSELADLRAGAAFTTSELPEGFPALRGETALEARFYRGDVWVNGRRRRTGLELRWRPGPFSVQAEYIRSEDERRGESVENTDLSSLIGDGWYVSGTWLVTGERKAGLDDPTRPLLPGTGSGAVELAVRIEALRFRSGADGEPPSTSARANVIAGNALHSSTYGVNWYLNRWMKVQLNFIRERIDDPIQGPLPDREVFWSRVLVVRFTM